MASVFENLTDEAISQLLLDCSTGKLTPERRAEVEAAAANVPELAEELALYKGLVKAGNPAGDVSGPGELGWARLSKALDEEDEELDTPVPANDNNVRLWRFAALAFGFLFVAQTAAQLIPSNGPSEPQYLPVSEIGVETLAQVAFAPTATELDMRALLSAVDGQIVRGPSAIGLYDIQFSDEATRDAAIERLKASGGIIESAAPKR